MPNRSPFLDALLNPLNLVTLALAVAAGLCATWWLFPLGLLVWGLMVLFIARDPSRRINYQADARAAALSPRFQKLYNRIVQSQVRIFNTLNGADGRTRRAHILKEQQAGMLAGVIRQGVQHGPGDESQGALAAHQQVRHDRQRCLVINEGVQGLASGVLGAVARAHTLKQGR